MKVEQKKWSNANTWENVVTFQDSYRAQLVLVFGNRYVLENPQRFEEIRLSYPNAHILLTSSSGDIIGTDVYDDQIILTAVYFEYTKIKSVFFKVEDFTSCFECGEKIALELQASDLAHIFVIADGQIVNGSVLVKGISAHLPDSCQISGGLSGDGERFEKTLVGLNSAPKSGHVAAIGFYGSYIKIGCGSVGGWDPFGPMRKVTRSKGNVLFELDGQPALDLYKKYLGEKAADLPGSALLFPLAIYFPNTSEPLVRTVLKIHEEEGSMVFAGSIPEGAQVQLMKANFERLIEGAGLAATSSHKMLEGKTPNLAILISCVGRRMVLGQRTEEELESVRNIIGKETLMTGFYSYGEIAPTAPHASCELHNQTMTITTLCEKDGM